MIFKNLGLTTLMMRSYKKPFYVTPFMCAFYDIHMLSDRAGGADIFVKHYLSLNLSKRALARVSILVQCYIYRYSLVPLLITEWCQNYGCQFLC